MRWIMILVLFPAFAFAGEDCGQLGGTCREQCSENEISAVGAFLDCTDKQDCCMPKPDKPAQPGEQHPSEQQDQKR